VTQSITATTAARLREMIVRGEFGPGEHLVEAALAKQLGTSRTPVRAALAAAHQAGLLDYSVNRGYTVRPFNVQDFVDAYEARGLLEGAICRNVAENGLSVQAEMRMRNAIEKIRRMLADSETIDGLARDRWRELNRQYHDTLIDESNNGTLVKLLRNLQENALVAAVVASYDRALLTTYNEQHEKILECLMRRQGTRAEHLMHEHVLFAAEQLVATIEGTTDLASDRHRAGLR
jgi:GntR family transcriptional regulator, vanillate catabolism transcriptional regulator